MKRGRLARFGLVLGLAGLFGCAPVPTPQVAVAPAPAAVPAPPPAPPLPPPPPVAVAPHPTAAAVTPPPPPPPPPAPPVPHQMASVPHPAFHHHYRRYAMAHGFFGPACGSVAHPCSVYHAVIPID